MSQHAEWCAKTARPADAKLRGYVAGKGQRDLQVDEAVCTCGQNPTARLLRKLKDRGILR